MTRPSSARDVTRAAAGPKKILRGSSFDGRSKAKLGRHNGCSGISQSTRFHRKEIVNEGHPMETDSKWRAFRPRLSLASLIFATTRVCVGVVLGSHLADARRTT